MRRPATHYQDMLSGITPTLASLPTWSDAVVAEAGIAVEDAPLLTIGGGIASFALVDRLRIYGVPAASIRVVTPQRRPYDNLRSLLRR